MESRCRLDIRKKYFTVGGGTQERVTQRGSGGTIPGNIPGQVGQGSEQPGLVENVPAYCRGDRLDGL